jgi:hypothetical protein
MAHGVMLFCENDRISRGCTRINADQNEQDLLSLDSIVVDENVISDSD